MRRKYVTNKDGHLWREPWEQPEVADAQLQLAKRELANWKAGTPHVPFDRFCDALKQCGFFRSFLEVGCGCGYYSEVVKHGVSGGDKITYCGVDVSLAMLVHARREFREAAFINADAGNLPFDDHTFEVVALSGVIGHLKDWRAAILEAVRVSRRWLVLHRIGCSQEGHTSVKEAYGVKMAERYFREADVFDAVPGLVQLPPVLRWDTDCGYQMTCAIDLKAR